MSTYCSTSDIQAVFGSTNVDSWADLDNDENATTIAARIARAIAVVSAEIDDIFRRTSYTLPLADEDGNTPTSIENLAASMAGLWLYEARGVNDMDSNGSPMHRLRYMQEWVRNVLKEIADGRREIDAVQ